MVCVVCSLSFVCCVLFVVRGPLFAVCCLSCVMSCLSTAKRCMLFVVLLVVC